MSLHLLCETEDNFDIFYPNNIPTLKILGRHSDLLIQIRNHSQVFKHLKNCTRNLLAHEYNMTLEFRKLN